MKINGKKYTWDKVYEPEKGEHGCFYVVKAIDNYYDFNRGPVSFVANIFSGAVAALEDMKAYDYDVDDSILEDIIADFENNGEYTNPDNDKYTYCIEAINIWKVEEMG